MVKNRFARLAFARLDVPDLSAFLRGPTALALIDGDIGPVLKILIGQVGVWSLDLKGSLVGGTAFDQRQTRTDS